MPSANCQKIIVIGRLKKLMRRAERVEIIAKDIALAETYSIAFKGDVLKKRWMPSLFSKSQIQPIKTKPRAAGSDTKINVATMFLYSSGMK